LFAGFSLTGFLVLLSTWWLMSRGARGAEIANVLTLPLAVAGTVFAALGLLAALGSLVPPDGPEPVPPADTESPGRQAGSRWAATVGRARRYVTIRTGIGLLLVLSLLATSPLWATPLAARAQILVAGCEHSTELRILASQEQLEPARLLADRYQRSARQYGCTRVHPYVFALSTKRAGAVIAAGWPDRALHDDGPRPDVWLADSAHEVARVRDGLARVGSGTIDADVAIAWSPIVLGVPASSADKLTGGSPGGVSVPPWPTLFQVVKDNGGNIVRPDPASSPAGELATALLYGGDNGDNAKAIEAWVGRSLSEGGYPLGNSLDLLCKYRQSAPTATAAIVSEQALARFNNGDPLGGACGPQPASRNRDDLMQAYYPPHTRGLSHRFVSFSWSAPAQAAAAAGFGTWLASKDGASALVEVGLRPPGFTAGGVLTARNGVRPDATFTLDPLPDDVLEHATAAQGNAQRHRVLFVLDSSGSMSNAAGAGQDSRFTAAADGVISAIQLMGNGDEFGLWVFPGLGGSEYREIVRIGLLDRSAVGAKLADIVPAGNTPLYRAIVRGVDAVGASDETHSNALVVLTDGQDTTSGLSVEEVARKVNDTRVHVMVVAIGETRCTTKELHAITTKTTANWRCLDADTSSINTKLAEVIAALQSVSLTTS
jgi:hypothetical protein